jgi:hypothetical protein
MVIRRSKMSSTEEERTSRDAEIADQIRQVRRTMAGLLAETVRPVYSRDGRDFHYETDLISSLHEGSYVIVAVPDGRTYLGQIVEEKSEVLQGAQYGIAVDTTANPTKVAQCAINQALYLDQVQGARRSGKGVILAHIPKDGGDIEEIQDYQKFSGGWIDAAAPQFVKQYFRAHIKKAEPALEIGYEIGSSPDKSSGPQVALKGGGFNRHTFLCGQSGSGKSFALAVILEQLLEKDAAVRIVVLDPNSDFIRLNRMVEDRTDLKRWLGRRENDPDISDPEYEEMNDAYAKNIADGVKIVRQKDGDVPLVLRRTDLVPLTDQGAILGLHPLRDPEEFNEFRRIFELQKKRNAAGHYYASESDSAFPRTDDSPSTQRRIENLDVENWKIWAKSKQDSLIETWFGREKSWPASDTAAKAPGFKGDWRCMVIDMGSLPSPEQKHFVATAVLGSLWHHRESTKKEPVLIVIDEAHNICPANPGSPLEELATEYAIRIAGEGRKYGLFLLVSSQRPSKVHSNVVSQCGNLVLMKMTSSVDQDCLAGIFSMPAKLP